MGKCVSSPPHKMNVFMTHLIASHLLVNRARIYFPSYLHLRNSSLFGLFKSNNCAYLVE